MNGLLNDLRYGLRLLLANRGISSVVILTLALGIGANTAIFTLVDSLVLRALPVRVASEAAERLRVSITLDSSHLARAASEDVVLEPGETQTLTFDVDLKTTGRFPVDVLVEAPGGRVIAQRSVTVRSTAYNRVALFITIAAAVVLLLAWGRRFLRRRTT